MIGSNRNLVAELTARPRLVQGIFIVLAGGVLVGVSRAALPLIDSILAIASTANWGLLAVATAVLLAYRAAHAGAWAWVLAAIGRTVSLPSAARMWILSEACRWLPGSVWSFGSRVVLGGRLGVPAIATGAGLALELAMTIGSWGVIALGGAALAGGRIGPAFEVPGGWAVTVGLVASVALLALGWKYGRRIRTKIKNAVCSFRLLREMRLRREVVCGVFVTYVLLGIANGMACWIVLRALAPAYDIPVSAVVTANAIAWLVGFFAVFAPAGLGVREGALILLLSPWAPYEYGALAAAFIRLAQIAVELICLLLASPGKPAEGATAIGRPV